MKQHRALLLTLVALSLIVGIPTGLLVREYHREQRDHALITAIHFKDDIAVASLLWAGADANTYEEDAPAPKIDQILSRYLDRRRGKTKAHAGTPTLILALTGVPSPYCG